MIYRFDHAGGLLSNKVEIRLSRRQGQRSAEVPAGLALSSDGKTLWVANVYGHSVARFDTADRAGPARDLARGGFLPLRPGLDESRNGSTSASGTGPRSP